MPYLFIGGQGKGLRLHLQQGYSSVNSLDIDRAGLDMWAGLSDGLERRNEDVTLVKATLKHISQGLLQLVQRHSDPLSGPHKGLDIGEVAILIMKGTYHNLDEARSPIMNCLGDLALTAIMSTEQRE